MIVAAIVAYKGWKVWIGRKDRDYCLDLLKGWRMAIRQQNKAIRRKNKLIKRLRKVKQT